VPAVQLTAGHRSVPVVDEATGVPARLLLDHPATAPETPGSIGPFPAERAWDAPVADGRWPLVAISHGTGSSPALHRGLAAALARAGFAVVAPWHARNNREDDALAGTAELLAARPEQLRQAVDVAAAELGTHVDASRFGVVGHSLGGYTALAAAGGRPRTTATETPGAPGRPVPVRPDDRVAALVLLAPATPWFAHEGALADVRAPVLMLSGERDEHTTAWHAEVVARGLTGGRLTRRVVPGAGHFSFLTPFPPHLVRSGLVPALDPPGFDRPGFHAQLYGEVATFLRAALG
jgi:predicted dienelactone hydrolase